MHYCSHDTAEIRDLRIEASLRSKTFGKVNKNKNIKNESDIPYFGAECAR